MPCSCPLVHRDFRKSSDREPRAPKKSLHYSGSLQRHLPGSVRPAIPCLPALTTSSIVLRMALRNASHPASPQILPSSHRPSGKSFWKGGARGGRTFLPQKGFPLRKLFFLQISRRLPNKKSPAERGQKKTPSRCELQGGLRTIFGSGLLSHMTLCSIIGDGELNFRVRNGVGCTLSSMATKEIWQIY